MKKGYIATTLAGIISLALTGCNTPHTSQNDTNTTSLGTSKTSTVSLSQLNAKFHLPQVSSDATMKTYSIDSAKQLGKTNPVLDAKTKNMIFAQLIPGLNIQTAVLNMEKTWGMKFSSGFSGNMYDYSGTLGNFNEGIQLRYIVTWHSPTHIIDVHCMVLSDAIGKNVSVSELRSVASNFLGYCVTLPYTNSEPQLAKRWVTENVQNPIPGRDIGTSKFSKGAMRYFGKVRFTVSEAQLSDKERVIDLDMMGSAQ